MREGEGEEEEGRLMVRQKNDVRRRVREGENCSVVILFMGDNCGMRGMREVWELGFTSLKWGRCGIKGIMGKGRGEFKNL